MKPPQRTEAERIAGTLTKAQRYWVAHAHEERGLFWTCPPWNTLEVLIRLQLMVRGSAYLRPLGKAVREVILSQEQIDER